MDAIAHGAEVSPDSATMLTIVGYSYINLNRLQQAIPPLTRAAKMAPQNYLVQSQLGYCLLPPGRWMPAFLIFAKAPTSTRNMDRFGNISGWLIRKKKTIVTRLRHSSAQPNCFPTAGCRGNIWRENTASPAGAADAQRATARARSLPAIQKPNHHHA